MEQTLTNFSDVSQERNTTASATISPINGSAYKQSLPSERFDAVDFIQHMQQVASDAGLRKMGLERIEFELTEARRGRRG